jgi:hypothetical protein
MGEQILDGDRALGGHGGPPAVRLVGDHAPGKSREIAAHPVAQAELPFFDQRQDGDAGERLAL